MSDFNPVLDGSMLDNYGGAVDSSGNTATTFDTSQGSSTWDGFVNTGADYDSRQNVPTMFNPESGIGKALNEANGGDVSQSIFSAISGFWNGDGDKQTAARNQGLIGSMMAGAGSSLLQAQANKKGVKVQIDAMREKQRMDAAEREKYNSLPADFAGGAANRSKFGV
ncbi:hypothetical protein [Deefgea sp. CFH1-16]|uniref:hypothetical protein n=1 Tax=Deefgea sp. CFH1-16 TaxID=2675457 RepID=UPI0015F6254B|nr:hypothetical protein [Deefgea sp. CFH1-16]MBM5575839.1 hypothetical protein [Deefgea sp. CFH1-16]